MLTFINKYFRGKMHQKKLDIVNEEKSPLFRIMSIFNDDEPSRRHFTNNMCAFHIGNGFIMSVAHNLRIQHQIVPSIPEQLYQNTIIQNLSQTDHNLFNRNFLLDNQTNKRYLNPPNQNEIPNLIQKLKDIGFDNRYVSMYKDSICKPFLIIQFRNAIFYNNKTLTQQINTIHTFYEGKLFRHTFLLELKLLNAFYNQDIALYEIINTDRDVINTIPSIKLDFGIYDKAEPNYFCLQSAPVDNLGRLLNEARIEGLLDHWSLFKDDIQGDYVFEGMRYLIEGYFRFGSSGAPYLKYDFTANNFKVNAIQSEACPIQLSINNDRKGNFQYVNAIASPVKNIENELRDIIK